MASDAQHPHCAPYVDEMTLNDLDLVDELEPRCFPTPWTRSMYESELKHNHFSHFLVIRSGRTAATEAWPALLAYSGYWLLGDEAHIVTLASHPDLRRRGLGEWMLLSLLQSAREQGADLITLEVRAGNQIAQALYRRYGFTEVGRRRQYYPASRSGPAEDALLLTLSNVQQAAVDGSFDAPLVRARDRFLATLGCG